MATNVGTIKQQVQDLAAGLPESATWDDVIEEARFRKAVEEGIAEADRGEFASSADVRTAFSKWGVKLAD